MRKYAFRMLVLTLTILFCSSTLLASQEIPSYAADANPNRAPLNNDSDAIYLSEQLKISPKTLQEENKTLHAHIHVTYPQIMGKTLSKVAQQFNQKVMQMVKTSIDQFKDQVKKDLPHMQTLPVEIQKNAFKMDYDVDVVKRDKTEIVSVRFNKESMQAGRAHPFHSHSVLNFDLIQGKELQLKNLFKNNAHFLETLSRLSVKQLNTAIQAQDQWMLIQGTKPTLKNYKNWNLEEDALLITFDEYQVAPYNYGPQEIEIPYSEIEKLLSPHTPLYSLAKSNPKIMG